MEKTLESLDYFINEENVPTLLVGDGPVVVVDDDEDQHFVIKRCYEKASLKNELKLLYNGRDLIKFLKQVQEEGTLLPAMVLLDINMPGMNGIEALAEIRKLKGMEKLPVIIMFTSSASPDDIQSSIDKGANGYWIKPMSITGYKKFFIGICPKD